MATAQIALLVCTLIYLWIRVFYFGDADAVAALSFSSSEQPPVPLVPWKLGVHTFGDFLLPFDLMIGVEREVYPGGVHQGRDLFDQRTSLIQYAELFQDFPEVRFPVSVLTSNQNQ